jgi:hypothetical protein
MTRTIYGRKNEIRGYVTERDDETIIYGPKNNLLGRYRKRMGMAYDARGNIIGYSPEMLMTLLCD